MSISRSEKLEKLCGRERSLERDLGFCLSSSFQSSLNDVIKLIPAILKNPE